MRWRGILFSLLYGLGVHSVAFGADVKNIRIWPTQGETRVVLDMNEKPVYSYFTLTKPDRLVLDLVDSKVASLLPLTEIDSLILKKVRKSNPAKKNNYRLVFELVEKVTPKFEILAPEGRFDHRLVIDFPNGKNTKNTKNIKDPIPVKTLEAPKQNASNEAATFESKGLNTLDFGTDDIIIAIDPGHGGSDPGALGPGRGKKRNYEKNVTLPISRQVVEQLNKIEGIKAVMTRTGDYFVGLNRRSEIARKNRAHLLVSIHADGFHQPQPSGASVWVLSNGRAQNEMGRWIEKHEEQSDLLGGGGVLLENNDDKNLSRAVLDLLKRNSQKEGYEVAKNVLKELKKVTHLHKSAPAAASLAVLKSPDIPSLLVEAGFMSNPKEEKLLQTKSHQKKIANAIFKGIIAYFRASPPDGTLLSALKGVKHRVKSGQSLASIAQKYGVSASKIKSDNKLDSSSLREGQVVIVRGVRTNKLLALSKNPPSSISSMLVHTVKNGDYLGRIAKQYGVSIESIRSNNKLRSDTLKLGQTLKIMGGEAGSSQHTVRRGEYLEKIANKYGVSVSSIRKLNGLSSDSLAIGQILTIPGK